MNNAQPIPAPLTTADDAERALADLNAIMDRLESTVAEETARVRVGRLRDAVDLGDAKIELARQYAAESARVRRAGALIAGSLPEALAALRERHDRFRAALQTNLTVLATAHAVSEGIIRGVSGELARKQAPQTYGAGGRANAPGPRAGQPLALSRVL